MCIDPYSGVSVLYPLSLNNSTHTTSVDFLSNTLFKLSLIEVIG